MSSKPIPDLPLAGALVGDEWFHIVQGGNSRKATLAVLLALLVDAAPATLDTLNELAAALGDDPNFATTITNLLATKAPDLLVSVPLAAAGYTIQATDRYESYTLTNAALVTVTVPLDASQAVPIGARIRFIAKGAAGATIALEDPGIELISRGNKVNAAQGSVFELHKLDVASWAVVGDVQ